MTQALGLGHPEDHFLLSLLGVNNYAPLRDYLWVCDFHIIGFIYSVVVHNLVALVQNFDTEPVVPVAPGPVAVICCQRKFENAAAIYGTGAFVLGLPAGNHQHYVVSAVEFQVARLELELSVPIRRLLPWQVFGDESEFGFASSVFVASNQGTGPSG